MRHFSFAVFTLSACVMVVWVAASAGVKDTFETVDNQRAAFELGGGEADQQHLHRVEHQQDDLKKIQQQQQQQQSHSEHPNTQHQQQVHQRTVEVKPSALLNSFWTAAQSFFEFEDSDKKNGDEGGANNNNNQNAGSSSSSSPTTTSTTSTTTTVNSMAAALQRDPLTKFISVVALGLTILYWWFRRAEADQRRRRSNIGRNFNTKRGRAPGSRYTPHPLPAWPASDGSSFGASGAGGDVSTPVVEEDEETELMLLEEEEEEELAQDDSHSTTLSELSIVAKPAAISAADASAVLVNRDDVAIGPCRAAVASRRRFVDKGGIVRTIAVILREAQQRTNRPARLLLRCDRSTGTLCLPAHTPVRFCIEELSGGNGILCAASRAVREELSRVLASSSSSSSRCLDAVVSVIDAILPPPATAAAVPAAATAASSASSSNNTNNIRLVARAEWLAPLRRSHEIVHVVEMTLTPEAAEALDRIQKERESDPLLAGSTTDTIALISQSDLASGVLPLHPLLRSLVDKMQKTSSSSIGDSSLVLLQHSLLGFGDRSTAAAALQAVQQHQHDLDSSASIIRLADSRVISSLPAVAVSRKTRVGGPKSVIPFATKLYQLSCAVQVKMSMKKRTYVNEDEAVCFDLLRKVSRSFAMVIENLCDELRTPVCIFYIVLRALDTVEDDVNISMEEKIKHLKAFVHYLDSPDAVPEEIRKYGDGNYLELMADFPRVVRVHCSLRREYRETIAATTRRMAEGMLLFLDAQNNVHLHSDYNEYCFYVAGLVGLGLTDMFASSGLEPDMAPGPLCGPHVEAHTKATVASAYSGCSGARASAAAMGLMLQKTNILRDYKEDIDDKRLWWPREVWGCYADDAAAFQTPEKTGAGLACLNHLIVDAMRHLPGCLDYLQRIRDPSVFSFCAVPQAMAIATLATCFNNPNVFHRNVKISKGEACAAMLACRNVTSFARWAATYVRELRAKTNVDPVLFANARSALAAAEESLARLAY